MMSNLYLTADQIGIPTGGGVVTHHELQALRTLGKVDVLSRENLECRSDPWGWDDCAVSKRDWFVNPPRLAHGYAGTFPRTVGVLKRNGCIVSWTVAAHDKEVSRRCHAELGLSFPYRHLTDETLWKRYIEGYRLADMIICPSTGAARTVREYGSAFEKKRIVVIPHGCTLSGEVKPFPQRFVCGYLGSFGADKGVIYLLQAWKKLNSPDATLLLAGKDSTTDWAQSLVRQFGGGNIRLMGWLNNVVDFYNSISVYCQSSPTEGFGIEVLEAMAHGRPVICSDGAGAMDMVAADSGFVVKACDVDQLVERIRWCRANPDVMRGYGEKGREIAGRHTWDRVRERYIQTWKEML